MNLHLRLEQGSEGLGFPESVHELIMERFRRSPSRRKRKKPADELWHHYPRLLSLADYYADRRFQVSELPALVTELTKAELEFANEPDAAAFLAAFRRLAVLARDRGVAIKAIAP